MNLLLLPIVLLVTEPPHNATTVDAVELSPQLQEQLQQVSALRQVELAELAAAAHVRQLQHELKVAQLQQQIRNVELPTRASVTLTEAENPLLSARLVGVAMVQQHLHVWFALTEQLVSLRVGEAHWLGLKVEHHGDRLRLKMGAFSRDFSLPKEL